MRRGNALNCFLIFFMFLKVSMAGKQECDNKAAANIEVEKLGVIKKVLTYIFTDEKSTASKKETPSAQTAENIDLALINFALNE